jgi:hypothetical protein
VCCQPSSRGSARAAVGGATPAKAVASVDQAKIYYCSEFIRRSSSRETPRPLERGNEYNVVTGGDNGYVYMWEHCVCIGTARASRGAVSTIKVSSFLKFYLIFPQFTDACDYTNNVGGG